MRIYRKKPVEIEGMLFTDIDSYLDICEWIDGHGKEEDSNMAEDIVEYREPIMLIKTLEGTHAANVGDYIIRGIKGEYYPCKPDIFDLTYEEVIA